MAKLDAAQRKKLIQSIRDRGIDYVAQEAVTLSSMPVWRDNRLQPRPFTLRLFLAKIGERWQVMPGGFVRIADSADARAVSLQRGAATADAWVLSQGPVGETTLLPTPERMQVQRTSGLLPSRAADNLFWVGRYVERAEATLRLVRAMINRSAEADDAAAPVIGSIGALLAAWDAIPDDMNQALTAPTARAVLTRSDLEGSLPYLAGSARSSASMIRDRFSPDAWRAISDLAIMIGTPLPMGPAESAINDRVEAALRIIASLSGLAQENMTQLAGWRFLELGRRIERALLTCRLVRCFAESGAPDGGLDVLLELADSQISYRQRYVMIAALAPVIDLVMLDPNNPRSVIFQLDRIEVHLGALPRRNTTGRLSPVQQIAASIATRLRTADAAKIDDALIMDIEHVADEAVGCDQRGLSDQQRAFRFHLGGAGVIYDVRQITTCAYASPVAHARHVLRLTPVSRDGERVHVASLQIVPEPVRRRESKDFFGNVLTWIEIAEPHDTLTVKLQARVAVDAPVEPLATPAWETVREEAFATSDIGPMSPAHFLFPSRMVSLDPEIRDYTRESFCARPLRARCRDRAEQPPQGRHRLRDRRHHGHHHAADVVRAAPRRLPGFRAYHDFRAARPRPAGGLCQRLSALGAGERRRALAGQRGHACLGAAMVRRRRRLGWA